MTTRSRIAAFGGSGALVVAGIVCAVVFGGVLGPVLAFVLISTGLVLATSLVFLEVGLSEDRARLSEDRARARAQRAERPRRVLVTRMRSHRRRLM